MPRALPQLVHRRTGGHPLFLVTMVDELRSHVCCHAHMAPTLWLLGYPDQAMASSQAGRTLVQHLSHPLSLTLALYWAAVLHHLRREASLTGRGAGDNGQQQGALVEGGALSAQG